MTPEVLLSLAATVYDLYMHVRLDLYGRHYAFNIIEAGTAGENIKYASFRFLNVVTPVTILLFCFHVVNFDRQIDSIILYYRNRDYGDHCQRRVCL